MALVAPGQTQALEEAREPPARQRPEGGARRRHDGEVGLEGGGDVADVVVRVRGFGEVVAPVDEIEADAAYYCYARGG